MERKDILSELEEAINGEENEQIQTSTPKELYKRVDTWIHKICEVDGFSIIMFHAIKIMDYLLRFAPPDYSIWQIGSTIGNNILISEYYFSKKTQNGEVLEQTSDDYEIRIEVSPKNIIVKRKHSGCKKEEVVTFTDSKDDIEGDDGLMTYIKDSGEKEKGITILECVDKIEDSRITDWVYSLVFSKAFEIVCRSVLSGEYAMDDDFSLRLRNVAKNLRDVVSAISERPQRYSQVDAALRERFDQRYGIPGSSFNYFSQCAITLCQILDEYNLFCIQTDAQVDKDPSAVLNYTAEYFGYHQYEDYLNKFLFNIPEKEGESPNDYRKGFLLVNPLLLHFFQVFLDMARIDQNFFLSREQLKRLLYLRELLDINENAAKREAPTDKQNEKKENKTKGKGIWQVWEKYQNERGVDYGQVEEMLRLANLKNDFLIAKILDSCYGEVKNLTYVGQSKQIVFDPRKCHDIERGNAELLLYNKIKEDKIELLDILDLYSNFREGKENSKFDEYEKEYIKAIFKTTEIEESAGLSNYYNEILKSRTAQTSKDIRHYNTKVIDMARNAILDTAEIRCWIKHHQHDFNEKNGFVQIKKVLLFLQERYEGDNVCYDNEMLTGYAGWCLDFLEIVAKKTPIPNSNRPSQIEDALLLLETLNRLLDKLIKSIEGKKYCLPYSSKFRGCFFRYIKHNAELYESRRLVTHFDAEKYHEHSENKENNEQSGRLERVFTGQPENDSNNIIGKKDFGDFIAANEKYREVRKSIIFIASSYIPPLNYEKLKEECHIFKAKTLKMRNEIHAEYFNRLREYIKEDSEKQLENNRRSVVQILGIFAAFLALTTVALSAANSESDLPFLTIMVGFTTCIVVFVALLYLLTHSKVQRDYEIQRYQDKIFKQNVNKEILRFIHVVKNTISDVDNETERGVTKKVNAILDKETTNIKMQEDCLCKRSDFEERVEQIENKLDRIKHFKRGRYYLAKSWKIHPAEWIIIILLVVMTALTILLSINNEGKNNMSTVQIVTKLEAKSKDGKTKDNADITNNDKNHGNKDITEEGQNMEKEAESQKIISEQDPILDGGKKRVKEPVPEK